jgi:uncharacterized RDD family membrane protein YckC
MNERTAPRDADLDGFSSADSAPAGFTIASPWRRLAARLVDFALVSVLLGTVVIRVVTGEDPSTITDGGDVPAGKIALAVGINLLIQFVWEVVPTAMIGATLGKRLLGLRVVAANDGSPVSWTSSIVRFGTWAVWLLIPVVSLLVPTVLVLVGVVFLFTKPTRQVVWDRTAKTIVVDAAAARR